MVFLMALDPITSSNGKRLKLGQFIYLGSNVSSTESDINICISKAWTVINRLMTIWSFWKIKKNIHPNYSRASTIIWLHLFNFNKTPGKKVRGKLCKDAAMLLWTNYGSSTPTKHQFYENLHSITQIIQVRWATHAGHC